MSDVRNDFEALIAEAKRADRYCPRFGEHNDRCGCKVTITERLANALKAYHARIQATVVLLDDYDGTGVIDTTKFVAILRDALTGSSSVAKP